MEDFYDEIVSSFLPRVILSTYPKHPSRWKTVEKFLHKG